MSGGTDVALHRRTFAWQDVIVVCVCIGVCVAQYWWLLLDRMPVWGNGIPYVLNGMDLCARLQAHDWAGFASVAVSSVLYPPFVDLSYCAYYLVAGIVSEMEIIVNALYFCAGIAGVYGCARVIVGRNAGLLAVFLFSGCPGILWYEKLGFTELHMACFFALCLWLVVKAVADRKAWSAIFAGVVCGCMMYMKYESALWFGTFISAVVLEAYVRDRNGRRKHLANGIIMAGVAGAMIAPWLVSYGKSVIEYCLLRCGSQELDNPVFLGLRDVTFYGNVLGRDLLTLMQFLLFFCAMIVLVVALCRRSPSREMRQVAACTVAMVVPFVCFSVVSSKNHSHVLPMLPLIAVCSGSVVAAVVPRVMQYVFLVLFGLHMIVVQSLPFLFYAGKFELSPVTMASPLDVAVYYCFQDYWVEQYGSVWTITPEAWDRMFKKVVTDVQADRRALGHVSAPTMLVLANTVPVRWFQIAYYCKKLGVGYEPVWFVTDIRGMEEIVRLSAYRYILIEEGEPLSSNTNESRLLTSYRSYVNAHRALFDAKYEEFVSEPTPRGTRIVVYRARATAEGASHA